MKMLVKFKCYYDCVVLIEVVIIDLKLFDMMRGVKWVDWLFVSVI